MLRTKRAVVGTSIAVIVLLAMLGLLLQRRTVLAKGPTYNLRLDLPLLNIVRSGSRGGLFIVRGSQEQQVADILCDFFERPIVLAQGEPGKEIALLLYMYDIGFDLLVFDLSKPTSAPPASFPLSMVFRSASFTVRPATRSEVKWMIDWLARVPDAEFRRASVPTVDLGYKRVYPIRALLADDLKEIYERADGP